jgi:hypothetical protein
MGCGMGDGMGDGADIGMVVLSAADGVVGGGKGYALVPSVVPSTARARSHGSVNGPTVCERKLRAESLSAASAWMERAFTDGSWMICCEWMICW